MSKKNRYENNLVLFLADMGIPWDVFARDALGYSGQRARYYLKRGFPDELKIDVADWAADLGISLDKFLEDMEQ